MGVLFDVINGDVEAVVDALYALTPDEFVAARNDAAKSLRKAKRADDSTVIARLSRPTAAAAALNRLARERPDLVETLLQAGARLRQVQDHLMTGAADVAAIHLASDERRAATRAIISALTETLSADEARRTDEWSRTLDAASTDDSVGVVLRRGRFAKLALDGIGFDGSVLAAPKTPTSPTNEAATSSAAHDRAETGRRPRDAEHGAPDVPETVAARPTTESAAAATVAAAAREAAARADEERRTAARLAAAETVDRAHRYLADVLARSAEATLALDDAAADVQAADEQLALAKASLVSALARRALAEHASAETNDVLERAAGALDDAERAFRMVTQHRAD